MSFVIGATKRTQLTTGSGGQNIHPLAELGLPAALAWRAGNTVSGLAPGQLPVGTALSTFDANGRSYGEYVAIYLSHDQGGIHALVPSGTGRWQSKRLSFQLPDSAHEALNGNKYQVIAR
ncbi:hypothetical protein [Dyella acidiphila]|uniref:Uncharacterized protein n=1 Tax=Dyella acidiphila TaxID=2775866 RepID=A0ABR9GAN4_9GAMM|nr:hypothetical protein [Dyella acidiphila]MBE1161099.1 hypothetical protein [Dyella acidiphila]